MINKDIASQMIMPDQVQDFMEHKSVIDSIFCCYYSYTGSNDIEKLQDDNDEVVSYLSQNVDIENELWSEVLNDLKYSEE